MTKPKATATEPAILQRRLIAVEPWKNSGPGWANAGVRAHFELTLADGTIKREVEYLYASKMTAEQHLAFTVAMVALEPFKQHFARRERYAGRGPE